MIRDRLALAMFRFRRSASRIGAAALLAGIGVSATAAPDTVSCGSVIVRDIVLKNDVGPCDGDGLVIGASGITVNLNGRKIVGTRRAHTGIRIADVSQVTVRGGIVEGFDAGMLITGGAGNRVTVMTVQNNRFGIVLENAESGNHRVENNLVTHNRLIGVFLRAAVSGASISRNQVNANVGYGIVVDGGSGNNLIEANEAVGNGSADISMRRETKLPILTNLTTPLLQIVAPSPRNFTEGPEFRVIAGGTDGQLSTQKDVTARLVSIDPSLASGSTSIDNPAPADTSTSGCEANDFAVAGFQSGDIALIQRGTCTLETKVVRAAAAGASAVVVFNEGQAPERLSSALGLIGAPLGPLLGVAFPVVSTSYSVGFALLELARSGPVQVRVFTDTKLVFTQALPATQHNLVTKNSGGYATDENFFCGTNRWSKNEFTRVNRQCVAGDYSGDGGPTGLGTTTNAY